MVMLIGALLSSIYGNNHWIKAQKVKEYDREMPPPHSTDQPMVL